MITDRFNALVLTESGFGPAVGMALRETNPLSLYSATQDREVFDAYQSDLEVSRLSSARQWYCRHQVDFAFSVPAECELERHLSHGANVSSGPYLEQDEYLDFRDAGPVDKG